MKKLHGQFLGHSYASWMLGAGLLVCTVVAVALAATGALSDGDSNGLPDPWDEWSADLDAVSFTGYDGSEAAWGFDPAGDDQCVNQHVQMQAYVAWLLVQDGRTLPEHLVAMQDTGECILPKNWDDDLAVTWNNSEPFAGAFIIKDDLGNDYFDELLYVHHVEYTLDEVSNTDKATRIYVSTVDRNGTSQRLIVERDEFSRWGADGFLVSLAYFP